MGGYRAKAPPPPAHRLCSSHMGLTKMKSGRKTHTMKLRPQTPTPLDCENPWPRIVPTQPVTYDHETKTLEAHEPMTVLEFHRHVCQMMDRAWLDDDGILDPDLDLLDITADPATVRITDERIEIINGYDVRGLEFLTDGSIKLGDDSWINFC